jgi:hypothetical protein
VAKKRVASKAPPWTFPKNTLEEALRIPRALEDKNAGKPMKAGDLVRAVGYKMATDWRFLDLLRSANLYGLVGGTGANAEVAMEKTGADVVAPSSASQRQAALVEAFRNVDQFKRVEEHYRGKRIPEDEFFENTLVRDFDVPRDRVGVFTSVFTANLKYLKLFNAGSSDQAAGAASQTPGVASSEDADVVLPPTGDGRRVRQFLDSCFVMMPFGTWFDRYYKEIYSPAIREAGFEPVRADELFASGTVVEQIWDQIQKASVLLADLTDKNANVFYELGLAHAAAKPVVFTAARIEDVPFDLRHLRVIVYEVREPGWSTKLGSQITDYLKHARSDPAKSIPHPFRRPLEDEAQSAE